MATPQAVTAVIRASRPEFKSTADKAAFAVHAILSVNGFSLRKVGEGVDEAASQGPSALSSEEADLAGWNHDAGAEGDGGTYSFLYVPEPGAQRQQQQQQQQQQAQQQQPPLLLVKCLRLAEEAGGVLLVSIADVASGRPPASLELQLNRYVPSLAPVAGGYEHLDELVRRVEGAVAEALEPQSASKGRASAAKAGGNGMLIGSSNPQQDQEREAARGEREEGEEEEERRRRRRAQDPLRDERYRPGLLPTHGPPDWGPPMGVGDEDLMPGGLPRPPGLGGLGGPGGIVPLGPRGLGGGMLVGPENPIFVDRLRHPPGGPGYPPGLGRGGAVPGMRWDPISPEGLQGWNPDDFTREGRLQRGEGFNDIGRPPPGRGPDWDNMFG